MGDIEETLSKRLKQLGIKRQVDAAGVVEVATTEIAKILPREDFEVISFKEGVLKVYVTSSSAASEIQLKSSNIVRQLPQKNISIRFVCVSNMENDGEAGC